MSHSLSQSQLTKVLTLQKHKNTNYKVFLSSF